MDFVACNVTYITKYYHKAAQFLLYFNTDIKSEKKKKKKKKKKLL